MTIKTLFTIQPHSIIDAITNSSSELFVGLHDAKDTLVEMIKCIYPEYRKEYSALKSIDELTIRELELYITYHYTVWVNDGHKHQLLEGFSKDEMYEEDVRFNYTYIRDDFVTESNRARILDSIDPNRTMFFLFSNSDNPKWEYQEKLCEIMTRYHLG